MPRPSELTREERRAEAARIRSRLQAAHREDLPFFMRQFYGCEDDGESGGGNVLVSRPHRPNPLAGGNVQ